MYDYFAYISCKKLVGLYLNKKFHVTIELCDRRKLVNVDKVGRYGLKLILYCTVSSVLQCSKIHWGVSDMKRKGKLRDHSCTCFLSFTL